MWNICAFLKSSRTTAISNLSACHTHIPQDLWLKQNHAEMAEQETTWSLTIMDGSWLVSGNCVYSTAMLYSTGGRANCSRTEGGWQSCVIEADRASGGWPSRAPLGIVSGRVDSGKEDSVPSMHGAGAMMDDLINLGSEKSANLILESCSTSWPQVLVPPFPLSFSFSSCVWLPCLLQFNSLTTSAQIIIIV